jgi:lysophospholipase L1-like esterase
VSPVPIGEITTHSEMWGFGEGYEKSRQLARLYRIVAEDHGAGFFDAGSVAQTHPDDGIHLDAAAHASLGAAMAEQVRAQFES